MMDTILNLGLNDEVVVGLAKLTNNERFAYDSYRRFIQMFSDVVMEVEKSKFEAILDAVKEENNCENDCEPFCRKFKGSSQKIQGAVQERKDLIFRRIRKHS